MRKDKESNLCKFKFNFGGLEMSPELTEFLSNTRIVRQTLAKILPPEAVNYFMMLVVKDLSHRKLEKLVETSVEESK